eukprot:gnl/MRDRNA2_/MRDRNA2_80878_c0_seq2.p1 gnl/MRDRNA2_/MRDRNA2_80878_c0~~gnl/MRDRNA2_/MRDRNA2_80878_c0_seq2.p1  ORF type:complete len:141 (+),score=8.40 gnl/MRDRNA2_/MRDRNA2_80878_c0_seq2:581-1003(+)
MGRPTGMARPTTPDCKTLINGYPPRATGRCESPNRTTFRNVSRPSCPLTAMDAMRDRLQVPPSPRRLQRENMDLAQPSCCLDASNHQASPRKDTAGLSSPRKETAGLSIIEKIEAVRKYLNLRESDVSASPTYSSPRSRQ